MKKLYKIDEVDILFTTVSVIKVAESEGLRTWKETKCLVQVRETKILRSCKRNPASRGFTRPSGGRGV